MQYSDNLAEAMGGPTSEGWYNRKELFAEKFQATIQEGRTQSRGKPTEAFDEAPKCFAQQNMRVKQVFDEGRLKRCIGFDCATKSLAVSVIDYNKNWKTDLKNAYYELQFVKTSEKADNILQKINNILDTIYDLKYIHVFDLIPEHSSDASPMLKSRRLKAVLSYIDSLFPKIDIVLIEYQMSSNQKSHDISSKLEYHYSDADPEFFQSEIAINKMESSPIIHIVGPSLKNTLSFSKDGNHSNFIKKYMNSYTANKNHTKFNFLFFLKEFKKEHFLKHIIKKNIDDAADAFMMTIAWLKKNYM